MKTKLIFTVFCLLMAMGASIAQAQDNTFGETFEAKKVMNYDKFLKKMSKKDGMDVVLKGKVAAVCQSKGCWMNIVSDKNPDQSTVVKFKDYGFFVPMDISGQTVIMKGQAYKEKTSVDELRHLAEDAGKSKAEVAAINEAKEELKFMATGVILVKD
jgi:hypothetical protein